MLSLNNAYMNKAELMRPFKRPWERDLQALPRTSLAVLSHRQGHQKDKAVQIIGLGTFKVSKRAACSGVNPKPRENKIKA
jgi:nucleoid DNA-binding protein